MEAYWAPALASLVLLTTGLWAGYAWGRRVGTAGEYERGRADAIKEVDDAFLQFQVQARQSAVGPMIWKAPEDRAPDHQRPFSGGPIP